MKAAEPDGAAARQFAQVSARSSRKCSQPTAHLTAAPHALLEAFLGPRMADGDVDLTKPDADAA